MQLSFPSSSISMHSYFHTTTQVPLERVKPLLGLHPNQLSFTNPIEVSTRCMLLPMSWRNLVHFDFGVCSQCPASICLLAPELLTWRWLVGRELTWHLSSCVTCNHLVLKGNVGSRRSDEVVWCARLLSKCRIGGSSSSGGLQKSSPVTIVGLAVGVWV